MPPTFRGRRAKKDFIMSFVYTELGDEDAAAEFLRKSYSLKSYLSRQQIGRRKEKPQHLLPQTKEIPYLYLSLEERLKGKYKSAPFNVGAVSSQPAYIGGKEKEWAEQELSLYDIEFYLEENDNFIQITYYRFPQANHKKNKRMKLTIETKMDQVEYNLHYIPPTELDGLDVITVREICRKWKDELETLKTISNEGKEVYTILAGLEDKYTRRNYQRYLCIN